MAFSPHSFQLFLSQVLMMSEICFPLFLTISRNFLLFSVKHTFLKSHFNYPFTNFFRITTFRNGYENCKVSHHYSTFRKSIRSTKKAPKESPFSEYSSLPIQDIRSSEHLFFMSGGLSKCYLVLLYVLQCSKG